MIPGRFLASHRIAGRLKRFALPTGCSIRAGGRQAEVELDPRGNVLADTVQYQTSREKLFSAGDMRR